MRAALLSDAHLGGPGDPNQQRLISFFERLEADRLALLGDIFQHWWHFPAPGAPAEPFRAYAPVIAALRRHRLIFVPGNHDWHAAPFLRDELGAEVCPPGGAIRAVWDGVRVHLAHGDEADRSAGYRLISAALHSRPFHALVDRLGPDRGWRLLARIAGEPHPDRRPSPALLAAQRACAARRLDPAAPDAADLVVFGHTHAPGVERIGGGCYVNLGDQVRHHTWLWFEDGRFELRRGTA